VELREQVLALSILGAGVAACGTARALAPFQPEDFRYLGAFRLPTEGWEVQGSWTDQLSWCKGVEAYYPEGEPAGPADGFPGSLFGVGHEWTTPAFEISIPVPVISDDVDDLPVARLLQGPAPVLDGIGFDEDLLKGIEYLPAQPGMSVPKLHVSFGKHYQYNRRPTHGWIDLDLSNPHGAGPWFVGSESQVSDLNTNEYVFAIPEDWAAQHAGGKRLACGRHREGQVATGPSIIAYGPWQSGDPPDPLSELSARPLVLYKDLSLEDGIDGHCWADNWTGGAWLRSDEKTSVVLFGTRGFGECWYGWQDGMTPEECDSLPGGCEANGYGGSNRGYYASYFKTVMLFYDPEDLARVASGALPSWEIQPYRVWDVTPYMVLPESTYEIHTGGVAYDEARGYLFVTERYGDLERHKPIVHVFALGAWTAPPGGPPGGRSSTGGVGEVFASPNPFRGITTITLDAEAAARGTGGGGPWRVAIYDVTGKLVSDLGAVTDPLVAWDAGRVPAGLYFVRATRGGGASAAKLSLLR
jgi:hypothetical protein